MKYSLFILLISVTLLPHCKAKDNSLSKYLENAELQYETEIQKTVILEALNDILKLSPEELKKKRYPDYTGKENQWNVPTLLQKYFVPNKSLKILGDDFYNKAKTEVVQMKIRLMISEVKNKH